MPACAITTPNSAGGFVGLNLQDAKMPMAGNLRPRDRAIRPGPVPTKNQIRTFSSIGSRTWRPGSMSWCATRLGKGTFRRPAKWTKRVRTAAQAAAGPRSRPPIKRCAGLPPEARFLNGTGDAANIRRRHQVGPGDAVDLLELLDKLGANPDAFVPRVAR